MTELEKKIYEAISANRNGLMGKEIAKQIGEEKSTVNSTLSRSDTLHALVAQGPDYRWRVIGSAGRTPTREPGISPRPDPDLHNICSYYLNCISLESSNSVSQFLTSQYQLKYAQLKDLEIDPQEDAEAIALLGRIQSDRNKIAYLGYPVSVFSFSARNGERYKKLAPVFIYQISYVGGQIELSSFPSVNMEILKQYAGGSPDDLAIELVNLEKDLGLNDADAEIDLDELALRLSSIRQWNYREQIDPYHILCDIMEGTLEDGIYNRAVVIEGERTPYTQGLESELSVLAQMPVQSFQGTALYSWVKGNIGPVSSEEMKPLLEVLPLNTEQALAVNTALRSDLTIITGPPGTGKSQVVTDLLIDVIWNGKSALFSSKNNKAVDVVDIRVNEQSQRPVLLRIGSNQYAARLAEIIQGMLSARPSAADQQEAALYMQKYSELRAKATKLSSQKSQVVEARNRLDHAEQSFCAVREKAAWLLGKADEADIGSVLKATEELTAAYAAACREKQNFFVRLFWRFFKKKRKARYEKAAANYNTYAVKYSLIEAKSELADAEQRKLITDAQEFEKMLEAAVKYKDALKAIERMDDLETLDKRLSDNAAEMAEMASRLWNKWLLSESISFSGEDREKMSSYIAAMRLAGDVDLDDFPDLKRQFAEMSRCMTKYLQCWAVTSLSAKSRIPFQAGLFDYIIIDEASQCDIASILPLLYRAKRAVIIGDPKQLSHISQLSKRQDIALLDKYHVNPIWSYSSTSLYTLAESKVPVDQIVQLRDHFRCCAEIIEFSNNVFYDGSLRTATRYSGLKTPAGERPGIRWIDVHGRTVRPASGSAYNKEEAEAVVQELKRLIFSGYQGTLGVTTPFRRQAEEIRRILENQEPRLYEDLINRHEFIADTVHKFQGDERDLMIFSPVVSNGASQSTLGFLSSTGNLFNVAITRARAVLVVVGNHRYCADSSVSYLSKFADYYSNLSHSPLGRQLLPELPTSRNYPPVSNPEQVSDWERHLYTALFDAGIVTVPQYPADKYKLDLALFGENGRKLDIEVDGEMYHRQWNGELCYRDQIRNQRMFELGWDVRRFWVYQIRDELPWCVSQICEWRAGN